MARIYITEGLYLVFHGSVPDGSEQERALPGQEVHELTEDSVLPDGPPPSSGFRWNMAAACWDDCRTEAQRVAQAPAAVQAARYAAYPPLEDLADALVHQAMGDNGPLEAYIAACIAVKTQIPKPNIS